MAYRITSVRAMASAAGVTVLRTGSWTGNRDKTSHHFGACVVQPQAGSIGAGKSTFSSTFQARRRMSRGERQRGGPYQSSQREGSPIVPWRLSNGCQSLGVWWQHEA